MQSLARTIALALLVAASGAPAAPWAYRGTLNDGGVPANGRYDFRLSLLDAAGTQPLVYPLTFSNVDVRDGAFAVDVDFGVDLAQFGAVTLRTEVGQGGSSFVALGAPQAFDAKAALVGVCWDTQGNAGTNPASDFLGTTDAQPLIFRAENLIGARMQRNGLGINWTAGYDVQAASGSSAIAIGGGSGQRAWTNGSTIAGGINNVAGDSSLLPGIGIAATVGGGIANLARGQYTTVAGGSANRAIGQSATVSGGESNKAIGAGATAAGGSEACAGGQLSWAGGYRVAARPGTSGELCSITSATSGDANGDEGTFVWGDATGEAFVSTGPNQFLVRAGGGVMINTNTLTANSDDLVLRARPSGDTDADIRLVTQNGTSGLLYLDQTTGGFFLSPLAVAASQPRLNVSGGAGGTATLSNGGSWTNASSRSYKTGFGEIDPLSILERVVALPIGTWAYRGSAEGTHLGPMGEDFKAAFDLAGDGKSISTVDADGVALAAIQGLNQKLEAELAQSRAENAGLQAQLQQLAARLAALEAAGEH